MQSSSRQRQSLVDGSMMSVSYLWSHDHTPSVIDQTIQKTSNKVCVETIVMLPGRINNTLS